jgi:hypothetical protein
MLNKWLTGMNKLTKTLLLLMLNIWLLVVNVKNMLLLNLVIWFGCLRKYRFPTLHRSKLMPRAAGPFKVLTKINDNAYILVLPAEFGVSTSFNVADLKPYLGEDEELPSRTTSVQEGEDDEDTTSTSTPAAPSPTSAPAALSSTPPSGPITRACARKFNFVMMLKNEGPKDWRLAQQEALCVGA